MLFARSIFILHRMLIRRSIAMSYLMRHLHCLSVILGVLLQLKPAYSAFHSSSRRPSEGFRQRLETRQGSTVVVPSEFLRRGSHASVVAGSWLYIDGGEFSFTDNGHTDYQYSNALLLINLSQNWTNTSVTILPNAKPTGVPSLNSPSLWYNEQEGVLYTGFAGATSYFNSPPLPPQSLWSFEPDGTGSGSWKEVINPDTSPLNGITQPVEGLTAYGPDSAWYLGGFPAQDGHDWTPNEQWLPGMVEFDMASKSFTNLSAAGYNINGTVIDGAMHYVPSFGQHGMILVMGGNNKDDAVSFGTVSVYDPATNEWFNQTTTGSAPSSRKQFCVAGINSTNNTYEIFVYGGWGGSLGLDAVQYDTINILSLPAFHWISVPYNPQNPRFANTCNAIGGGQIVIIGGVDANSDVTFAAGQGNIESTYNTSADPFSQGLAIFDMTTLEFAEQYTAGAYAYEQSDMVKEFYSRSQNAYKQNLTPGVAALVQVTNFTKTTTSSSIPNNNTSTPLSPVSPTHSSSPQASYSHHISGGIIAGSVFGSLVFLALAATSIIYLLKRQGPAKTALNKRRIATELASDSKIIQGWAYELPDKSRPTELIGQALVELTDQALVEMGHRQGEDAWEAVEIGQPATPVVLHELYHSG